MAVTGEVRGVVKMTAAADAITGRKFVTMLRWVNATAADQELSVTDTTGNVLWESVADGANFIDAHPLFKMVDGIIVATMGSGTFYAYID